MEVMGARPTERSVKGGFVLRSSAVRPHFDYRDTQDKLTLGRVGGCDMM